MNRIKFYNARIITPFSLIENGSILVEDSKIVLISDHNVQTSSYIEIDVKGNYVSPGWIDIHTHGAGGYDFMDGTIEAFIGVAEEHARHGTTAMVPTTLTSTNEELKNTFNVYQQAKDLNKKGSLFLGLHLEGPYFSMKQKGAQDPRYIRNPDLDEYEKILQWSDDIIRWSAAPELQGALDFGRYLSERSILPSIAHTDATYEEVLQAFQNGFTHVTHLYSCTSSVKRMNGYRYAGVVESAFLIDDMTVEIIADGVHLPPSLLKLVYKIKGPSGIALVSDSMRAAGMPDGESILGSLKNGQKVVVEDGVAKLPDRTAFAGSVATADILVKNMYYLAEVPLIDAIRMITLTPAEIIGVSHAKGSIEPGKDADLVIFDEKINVIMTVINGRIVYQS